MDCGHYSKKVMEHEKDIAALKESGKSAHKRIDRIDKLTEAVRELAQSTTTIATEVKFLASKFDKEIEDIAQGQKSQGERLGELEKRGSKKLENIVATIITVVITAVIMYFVGNIGI